MLAKMKTYNFWIKLTSAVLLLVRIIGSKFGFEIDSLLFMDIVTAVAGILVVMGIISAPTVVTTKEVNNILENTNLENIELNSQSLGLGSLVMENKKDEIIIEKSVDSKPVNVEPVDIEQVDIEPVDVEQVDNEPVVIETIDDQEKIKEVQNSYAECKVEDELSVPNNEESEIKTQIMDAVENKIVLEEIVESATKSIDATNDESLKVESLEQTIETKIDFTEEAESKASTEILNEVGVAEEVIPSQKDIQDKTETQGDEEAAKSEATQDNAKQSALTGEMANVNNDAVVGILDRLSLLIEKLEKL